MRIIMYILLCSVSLLANGQNVSNYHYQLDNGIKINTEKGWNYVHVYQVFDTLLNQEPENLLEVHVNAIGDLIKNTDFKVFNESEEVLINEITPDTYLIKVKCLLSSTPGNITFDVNDITVKSGFSTRVFITIRDVQVTIDEKPGGNLCYYESKINRYAGNNEQNLNWGIPYFYLKGMHDKRINPDEPMGEYYGKIKPGTYDLLIKIEIGETGFTHKIWFENFNMNPGVDYRIKTNLNTGEIIYSGGDYEVKVIHFYPAGTAGKINEIAKRQNNLEIISFERPGYTKACPTGKYDVLLNFGYGAKYEWRKNVEVKYGQKTEIK